MHTPAIKRLIAEVPSTELFLKPLDDGRPAIQNSSGPVFIYRNTEEGSAYAKLVVEALRSLSATDTPTAAAPTEAPLALAEGSPLEQQFLNSIEKVLKMNKAFEAVPAKLLSKLLYAAIAPLVNPACLQAQASTFEQGEKRAVGQQSPAAQRLEGVESFCNFLLSHGDQFSMPSEAALLSYANNWNESQNGGQAAA